MKIVVVCQYFAPEPGAPSARWLELSRAWVAQGHSVKVVTCFPNHPTGVVPTEYRGRLRAKETMDGIAVFRNWVYATPNEGVIRKTLSHVSFMCSSVLLSLAPLGRADAVIVSSPAFFSLFSGYVFSRLKRAAFIVEIRDLWPAAIVELGVLKNRAIIKILETLELWVYRAAQRIVVVTDSFRDNLASRGVPREKISVITNGADLERFSAGPKSPAVASDLACDGKTLVLYIGVHGISQGLDSVIRAAAQLADRPDIVFGFVGDGAAKAQLIQLADQLGLSNVHFLPSQNKERMADFYRTSDICLVPLKNVPLFKTFIPSKMFEIMACAKPIVASLSGEAANILRRSGGAVVTEPENIDQLAAAIADLADDRERRNRMGESAAAFVAEHYSRSRLAKQYLDVLDTVVNQKRRQMSAN